MVIVALLIGQVTIRIVFLFINGKAIQPIRRAGLHLETRPLETRRQQVDIVTRLVLVIPVLTKRITTCSHIYLFTFGNVLHNLNPLEKCRVITIVQAPTQPVDIITLINGFWVVAQWSQTAVELMVLHNGLHGTETMHIQYL